MIPTEAAVPALVLVGFLMMQQVKGIDWDDLEIAIPAFLTIHLSKAVVIRHLRVAGERFGLVGPIPAFINVDAGR